MRAINIFIILVFILLNACASIEVAEVVTKTSIKVAENVSDQGFVAMRGVYAMF